MTTKLVNGVEVEMESGELAAWLASIPPPTPPPEPEKTREQLAVDALLAQGILKPEDVVKGK